MRESLGGRGLYSKFPPALLCGSSVFFPPHGVVGCNVGGSGILKGRFSMDHRVGACSICGGSVHGFRGAWMSVSPPPPDRCIQCGAISASDVITMTLPKRYEQRDGRSNFEQITKKLTPPSE
jgi:hypothetical protein